MLCFMFYVNEFLSWKLLKTLLSARKSIRLCIRNLFCHKWQTMTGGGGRLSEYGGFVSYVE